ncbi:hypothetical protein Syun_011910 [Stephania yunnanensis]|uniref:Uncharacterized protein n=1 Tax=Stephania yunnanensis TaxID=152371 RepID=A0AAP0PII9_9MAGN
MIDFGLFDFGRKLSSLFDFGLGFLLSFSHKPARCGALPSSSSLPLRPSMQNREGERRRRAIGRGRGGPSCEEDEQNRRASREEDEQNRREVE